MHKGDFLFVIVYTRLRTVFISSFLFHHFNTRIFLRRSVVDLPLEPELIRNVVVAVAAAAIVERQPTFVYNTRAYVDGTCSRFLSIDRFYVNVLETWYLKSYKRYIICTNTLYVSDVIQREADDPSVAVITTIRT